MVHFRGKWIINWCKRKSDRRRHVWERRASDQVYAIYQIRISTYAAIDYFIKRLRLFQIFDVIRKGSKHAINVSI